MSSEIEVVEEIEPQNLNTRSQSAAAESPPRPGENSLDDSELTRKIVRGWEEVSIEVRQAYKQFVGAVMGLIDGEATPKEFREVAKKVYDLCTSSEEEYDVYRRVAEKKGDFQKLFGYTVSDIKIQKVALLAQRLLSLQPNNHQASFDPKIVLDGSCGDASEFGSDFIFHTPSRFLLTCQWIMGSCWRMKALLLPLQFKKNGATTLNLQLINLVLTLLTFMDIRL